MAWWPLGHQAIASIVVLFSQNAVTYLPEINRVKFGGQRRPGKQFILQKYAVLENLLDIFLLEG